MIVIQKMIEELQQANDAVAATIQQLTDEQLNKAPIGKWNALGHLYHLNQSVKPLTWAFSMPKWLMGWYFGKANRPSRSYEALVEKYTSKLQTANPVNKPFGPSSKIRLNKVEDLDRSVLPHPLLGKLTLREMVNFTIYHNLHHLQIINQTVNG